MLTVEQLSSKLGHRFKKQRYGTVHLVTLEEVRRDKVQLRELEHKDAFMLPIAKFLKFYKEI